MTTTIWHNPRCSKSRQTLALLIEKDPAPVIIKYLETPPSETELRAVLALLGLAPIAICRTGEKTFKDLGLSKTTDPDTLIAAMLAHPILIERPIVFTKDAAIVGRPPENVNTLF